MGSTPKVRPSKSSQLEEYALEIGVRPEGLSLEKLIESHRHLRVENAKKWKRWREEMDGLRKTIQQLAMDDTWIKLEKLKAMTIQELVDFLKGCGC